MSAKLTVFNNDPEDVFLITVRDEVLAVGFGHVLTTLNDYPLFTANATFFIEASDYRLIAQELRDAANELDLMAISYEATESPDVAE